MINFVALSLLLSSLVTAGVLTPSQEPQTPHNDVVIVKEGHRAVIVKEGHRAVIVEFEKETDGSTRVSISPPQQTHFPDKPISEEAATDAEEAAEAAKEKVKEPGNRQGQRELVCDAFGKCTHRIASVIGKAKEKVAEKAQEVEGGAKEVVGEPFEIAKETTEKAKTMGKHVQGNVSTTIESAKEKTKEKAEQGKEMAEQVAERAKEKTKEKAEQAKEMAERAKEKTKEKAEQVRQMTEQLTERAKEKTKEKAEQGREMAEQVAERAKEKTKEKAERGKEMAEQVAERAKTGGSRVKEGGEKALEKILRRGRAVAAAMDSVVAVVHLLGFSTAYGICLWVTFVSGYVLAGTLPRQQFGMVQSRIYPVYFRVTAFSVGVALVGHLLGRRGKLFTSKCEMLQGFHLLGSLLMILINSFYLEPRATKVMFEKMKSEKEEGRERVDPVSLIPARGAAETIAMPPAPTPEKQDLDKVKSRIVKSNERLKKLNAYSSLLNILTLVALTWHLVYLGQRLHLSC